MHQMIENFTFFLLVSCACAILFAHPQCLPSRFVFPPPLMLIPLLLFPSPPPTPFFGYINSVFLSCDFSSVVDLSRRAACRVVSIHSSQALWRAVMSRAMPGLRYLLSHSPLSPPPNRHPHTHPNPPLHPNSSVRPSPPLGPNSPSQTKSNFNPRSNFHPNSRSPTASPTTTTSSSPRHNHISPHSQRRLHPSISPHRSAASKAPLLSRATQRHNRRPLSPVSPIFKSPAAVTAVSPEFASPSSPPPADSFLKPPLDSQFRGSSPKSPFVVEGPPSRRTAPSSPPPRKRPATARPAGTPRFVRAHPRAASSMRNGASVESPNSSAASPANSPVRRRPGSTTRGGNVSNTRPTVRPVSDEIPSPVSKDRAHQEQTTFLSPSGSDVLSTNPKSHLRYGTVGLRAGFLRQDSRPFAFLAVKANRYARLQGTLLSLAKGPHGEVIWSFDIAGSVVETVPDDRKIAIFMLDSQRRKRRVMVLSPPDAKSFHKWSLWLSRASKSVLEMHYSMDRLISKGAFARVVLGKDLHTGENVAIKLIEKSNAPPSERKYFEREVKIMQTLSHPNIVCCYDVFDTRLRTRIVMEYMEGGTLGDLIANHRSPLPESIARHIMHGILSGVKYLHDNSTIHRDLKPDNCLLSKTKPPYGPVKLSDFGLSNIVDSAAKCKSDGIEEKGFLTSAVGSPAFVAPEIFESRYGTAVDIWSCGIILYMMLSGGSLPFRGQSASEVVSHARSGRIDFSSRNMRQTSELAKRFLLSLLHVDSNKRLTAQQALAHPWLLGNDSSTQPK